MIRRAAVLTLLAALLTAGLAASALGQEHAGGLRVTGTDTAGHPTVQLTVSVPSGLYGDRVPPEAFTVLENGQPRTVDVVPLPGDQLEVVVVLDTTGSMSGAPLNQAKTAAADFLHQLPQGAQVSVLEFKTETHVVTEMSPDIDAHLAGIAGLEPGGYTALYDAVADSLDQLTAGRNIQRSVVLLTDGEDNSSARTLDAVLTKLRGHDVTLYAVEFLTSATDSDPLEQMVAVSGGEVFRADDVAALNAVYAEVASELSNRYVLTYESETHGRTDVAINLVHGDIRAGILHAVQMPAPPPPPVEVADPAPPPAPEPAPAPEPQPPAEQVVTPGLLAQPWTLAAGTAALSFALFLFALIMFFGRAPRARVQDEPARGGAAGGGASRGVPALGAVADRMAHLFDGLLRRRGLSVPVNAALERAGIPLRPGEFLTLVLAGSVTAGLVAFSLIGPFVGGLAAVAAALASRTVVRLLAARRQARFADQLGDTLQLLAGSVRSGYGLLQAMESVSREAESPSAEEFRRVLVESRLGRSVDECLRAMAVRVASKDFDWVVQAITIHREVGGDLAEILDSVSATIRERNHLRRQIKALSAEGRLSAGVLLALPFVVFVAIRFLQPTYIQELTSAPVGWLLLAFAGGLMTAGALWIRKIVRLVY